MNIARITLFGRVQLVNPKATGVIPMAPAGGRVICRPLRYATPRRLSRVEPTTTVVITRPSFCDTKNDTESLHKRARHEGTTVGVWDNIQRPVSCVSLCDPERLATVTGGRGGRFRRATAAAASAAPSFARRAAVGAAAASVLAPPALPQRRRQHVSLFCLAVHWHVGMQFGS